MCGLIVSGPADPIRIVWPSGVAEVTATMPIAAPAPGRFSTTKRWPTVVDSRWPITRATMSLVPPGGNGTTSRTGCAG
jgi:hypothetical protein